jgi:hypothetical protein
MPGPFFVGLLLVRVDFLGKRKATADSSAALRNDKQKGRQLQMQLQLQRRRQLQLQRRW